MDPEAICYLYGHVWSNELAAKFILCEVAVLIEIWTTVLGDRCHLNHELKFVHTGTVQSKDYDSSQ